MERWEILQEIETMTRVIAVNNGLFGRESLARKANNRIAKLMAMLEELETGQ